MGKKAIIKKEGTERYNRAAQKKQGIEEKKRKNIKNQGSLGQGSLEAADARPGLSPRGRGKKSVTGVRKKAFG